MINTLRIKNFLGINKKADPTDMDQHECQTLNGFDTYKMPGALVKRKGYTDQAGVNLPESYPAWSTIYNYFRFKVNKPSSQVVTLVHATAGVDPTGGTDNLYVDYTYASGSWTQAWVKLTEREENIAATTSTDGDNLYCTNLDSSTNDYYNGWYVFNWTRKLGSLVSDFTGATQKAELKTTITSQVSGDKISIYRFPLIIQYEGEYTTDTDSSTTQVIDSENFSSVHFELRSDLDDRYNSWILTNTTADDTASITDYFGDYPGSGSGPFSSNNRRLVHGTLTGQTKAQTYYLYDPTRTDTVDDKIQFRQRPNACIMATGNAARYPKQFPLWYGYIRNTYYFGKITDSISEGYYLEPATLDAPDDDIISAFGEDTGTSDPIDAGTYYVACAYVYDGFQVGPLTSGGKAYDTKLAASGTYELKITLNIGYSARPNMKHSRTLNKRVTAVEVYMSNDFIISRGAGTWYRVATIPIRQDYDVGYGGISSGGASDIKEKPVGLRAYLDNAGRAAEAFAQNLLSASWTGTDSYTRIIYIEQNTWDNKGFYYSATSGGIGGDRINYEVGKETLNHSIVGKLFGDKPEESVLAFSPLKIDGTPSPDYFPVMNVLDLARYGVFTITNLEIVQDRIYIIGSTKSIRMIMSSDIVPGFRIDSEFEYVGTDAISGMLKLKDGVFVMSKRGLYYLDNVEHLLSAKIEDIDDFPIGATTMSEACMGFNGETHEITIAFPTDKTLYTYNILNKQWSITTVAKALRALIPGESGELYATDTEKIYRLNNGTTDAGTSIAPEWKSKVYNMGAPDLRKVLTEIEITYKSNTAFEFDVYLERSSTALTWNSATDNQFAAATTTATVRLRLPMAFNGKEFEFGITIPTALRATNTYLEIHEIDVKYTIEERND